MLPRPYRCYMDESLKRRLRARGDELLENHDGAIIADVIGEVESLDSESSDETADLLRTMVGIDGE